MTPCQNPVVIGSPVGDETVLVLPDKGKVKVLNEVGGRIWSLIDGRRSVREIAALIANEYNVSVSEAEKDTLEFIDSLVTKNVLLVETPPGISRPA